MGYKCNVLKVHTPHKVELACGWLRLGGGTQDGIYIYKHQNTQTHIHLNIHPVAALPFEINVTLEFA